jgi:hypothetical protein
MEEHVNDNSRAVAATIVGAAIGGLAGYVLFTERGRAFRRQLDPAIENFVRELSSFRLTVEKAAGAASEGWKLLNEAMDSGSQRSRYPAVHQTSPF